MDMIMLWIKSVVDAAGILESSICYNNQCADDQAAAKIIYSNKLANSFPHAAKPGGCVWNKEDHYKNSSDRLQNPALVSGKLIAEKGR